MVYALYNRHLIEMSLFCLAQGILKLSLARDDKLKRVSLRVDEADITFALKVYTLHSLFIIPKMQFLKLTPSLFIAPQEIRFFRNCLL